MDGVVKFFLFLKHSPSGGSLPYTVWSQMHKHFGQKLEEKHWRTDPFEVLSQLKLNFNWAIVLLKLKLLYSWIIDCKSVKFELFLVFYNSMVHLKYGDFVDFDSETTGTEYLTQINSFQK